MHTYTQLRLSVITFIALTGLAMAAPILDPSPYDPQMDTCERVNSDEEITYLNYQDCMNMFGMERNEPEPEPTLQEKTSNPCVVICDNQDKSQLDRCDIPFTILSAISSEVVANYSIHEMLLVTQFRRYMDYVVRSFDPSEYEIPNAVLEIVFREINTHTTAMREIIHSVEHYLGEIELDSECAVLLDIWMGYRMLKMAGIL
jgi:hypothetical protein